MDTEKIKSDIAEWLSAKSGNEKVASLMGYSVGRLLLRQGLYWKHSAIAHEVDVDHVRDWLAVAVAENAPWLERTDEQGRPKKLMKFGSFREMAAEADKAMRIAIQKTGCVEVDAGHERIHMELADGHVMVEMLSPEALDRESSLMQHCVGNGGYDYGLAGDEFMLLSLRDRFGRPHATVLVDREAMSIREMKGKQNERPVDKYMGLLREFILRSGLHMDGDAANLGMVEDIGGKWHPLDDLPERLVTRGSLSLAGVAETRMPKHLVVNGYFVVPHWLEALPEETHVRGELHTGMHTPRIPEKFSAGSMTIHGTYAGVLPARMDVADLRVSIPDGSRILPKQFEVSGSLVLDGIKHVPSKLKTGGMLYLKTPRVRKWRGDIDCGGIEIYAERPLAFDGGMRVRGDLVVYGDRIALPGTMRVTGNADFTHNANRTHEIAALPRRMFVGGDLDLGKCLIGAMPSHLEVGGDLVLTDAVFDTLAGLKRVSGGLRIEGTSVRELPVSLKRVGGLWAAKSALEKLPDGFSAVKSNLVLIGTPMTALPPGLFVKENFFGNDIVEYLPDDAVVKGKVYGISVPSHMERQDISPGRRRPDRSLFRR